jgi:hypothetical protein
MNSNLVVVSSPRASEERPTPAAGKANSVPAQHPACVIDLGQMDAVYYERQRREFAVEPGATLGRVYQAPDMRWGVRLSRPVAVGAHRIPAMHLRSKTKDALLRSALDGSQVRTMFERLTSDDYGWRGAAAGFVTWGGKINALLYFCGNYQKNPGSEGPMGSPSGVQPCFVGRATLRISVIRSPRLPRVGRCASERPIVRARCLPNRVVGRKMDAHLLGSVRQGSP